MARARSWTRKRIGNGPGRGVGPAARANFSRMPGRTKGYENLARSSRGAGRGGSSRSPRAGRQGVTGRPRHAATAPSGTPVVSLATRGAGATRVVGGTPAMRARAPTILDGMGDVAIIAVRFRHANGAIWLSTTVAASGSPFVRHAPIPARGRRATLAGIGLRHRVPDEPARWRAPRPRDVGGVLGRRACAPFSSETGPADPYVGPAEPDSAVRSVIAKAAARARFRGRLDLADAPQPPGGDHRRARRRGGRRSRAATAPSSSP